MPKRVFNKALLKNFMFLLIIIAFMFASNIYIYKNSMDAMYKQAEKNNELVVKGIIQSFEESFKEINNIIYTVGTLPYRVYDREGHDNIDMNSAFLLMNHVRQLITQNYVHDFIIFYKDSDLVLTLNGTDTFNNTFSRKYKNTRYSPAYWRNFSETSHPMKIIPSDYYTDTWMSSEKIVRNLLAIVASNQMGQNEQNIVVFIDLAKLYDKVNKQSMMEGTSLIVLDKDKNVILSTSDDYEVEGLEGLFFDTEKEMTFKRGNYNYHCIRSDYNSFIYINKVPARYDRVVSTIKVNKIILFVTTFTGILISLLLSIYIYRPVRKLAWLVGIKDYEKGKDYYTHIYNSIEKIQQENQQIQNRMDNEKNEIMRSIFFKMIDDITFYKHMKDQIDTYFKVIFSNQQFLMAAFDLVKRNKGRNEEEKAALVMPDEIADKIRSALNQIPYVTTHVFYFENMKLIALVGVKEPIKREKLLSDLNDAKERLQEGDLSDYTIIGAVSKFYTDVQDCRKAFDDIRLCFSYRNIKNTKDIVDIEKIDYNHDVYMPLDFNEKLTNFIMSGNIKECRELVNQVIQTNVQNNINYVKFQNILLDIFNIIINIMGYLKVDKNRILELEMEFKRKTVNLYHLDEITAFLMDLAEKAADEVRDESSSKLNKEFVIQYIQLHYAEDLYLDKMAEVFNTSPKYFSNFFKKSFGINFVKYLNKVRMSHAKELLKNSDISISDIAEKVGYITSSTFASTFKKYCGITPTEFRKKYRD